MLGSYMAVGSNGPQASAIPGFARDDVPDTAGWVCGIPDVARDDVDVPVHDRLAGHEAYVDANVIAGRPAFSGEAESGGLHEADDVSNLFCRQVENVRHVSPGNDERMTR
jgi:hypothetical protein